MKLIFYLFLFPQVVFGASYYVATNGLDSNPGTVGSPFLTVQKGVNTAQAGDTVFLTQGDYREEVDSVRSGTASNPITIDGQGVASFWIWRITHHDYQRLINCTLLSTNGPLPNGQVYFGYTGSATGCSISNCVIDGGYSSWSADACNGLIFGGTSTNCLMTKCTLSNQFEAICISMQGFNNVVSSNSIVDLYDSDCFRYFGGTSNYFIGNKFTNESLVTGNFHADCFQTFASSSPNPAQTINYLWIQGNTFKDGHAQIGNLEEHNTSNGPTNIYTNIFIVNNLFIRMDSILGSSVPNHLWANNTFIQCGFGNSTSMLLGFSKDAKGNATRNFIYNNIFYRCDQGTNDPTKGWYAFGTGLTGCLGDYNYAVGYTNSAKATGEAHGLTNGAPGFVNESSDDYTLSGGSQLIGKGTNLSSYFLTDFNGLVRGTNWDIGAFAVVSGNSPSIAVSPSSLNFGTLLTNTSSTLTFGVTNTGTGDLVGSATTSSPFSVIDPAGGNYSLLAGGGIMVTIQYSPTTAGNDSGTVTCTGGGGATVSLSGSATNAPFFGVMTKISGGTVIKGATSFK